MKGHVRTSHSFAADGSGFVKYSSSHELWASIPEDQKGLYRKNNPGMNDNGIRWLLWRRRDWKPVQPDPYECSCHKLHKTSCPNAIARRLSEKTPESPSNSPDPTSGPSPHPTGDNAPESK